MSTTEYQAFEAACTEGLRELQHRSSSPVLRMSAKDLHTTVRTTLLKATQAELLKTASYDVFRLLQPVSPSRRFDESTWIGKGETFEFSCGPTQDERKEPNSRDCLVRDDDAVLSFSVTVRELKGQASLELIAYRFDLTFSTGVGPRYVRFDLDSPNKGHNNEGLRAHIHPGLAEGRLPSPVLAPVELLRFLLVHLRK